MATKFENDNWSIKVDPEHGNFFLPAVYRDPDLAARVSSLTVGDIVSWPEYFTSHSSDGNLEADYETEEEEFKEEAAEAVRANRYPRRNKRKLEEAENEDAEQEQEPARKVGRRSAKGKAPMDKSDSEADAEEENSSTEEEENVEEDAQPDLRNEAACGSEETAGPSRAATPPTVVEPQEVDEDATQPPDLENTEEQTVNTGAVERVPETEAQDLVQEPLTENKPDEQATLDGGDDSGGSSEKPAFEVGQWIVLLHCDKIIGRGVVWKTAQSQDARIHGQMIQPDETGIILKSWTKDAKDVEIPFPPELEVHTFGDLTPGEWIMRWPSSSLKTAKEADEKEQQCHSLEKFPPATHKVVAMVAMGKTKLSQVTAPAIKEFIKKDKGLGFKKIEKMKGNDLVKKFAEKCVEKKLVQINEEAWQNKVLNREDMKKL